MKRIVAAMVLVGLVVALVATPTPALAWRGHRAGHGGHGHGGYFAGGLALGALTGVIVGGILATGPAVVVEPAPVYVAPPPQPVYVQPAPVYVAPQPVCSSYWVPQYYRDGVWVQGHWEQVCR
jgi:PXPV repeat (3 copies)